MTIGDFLQRLRSPKETAKTIVVAVTLAAGSIIGTQVTTGMWTVGMEWVQFPMLRAEIESVRKDVAVAPCSSNAMLVAQSADWNKRIEHEKEANRLWYADRFITDRWNAVERIEMPCQK